MAVNTDLKPEYATAKLVYLHMVGAGEKRRPIQLGTGRNAVVLLASSTPDLQFVGNRYYAAKFLRDDFDPQYSETAADNFFREAEQMRQWGVDNGAIVDYEGWGAIAKDNTRLNTRGTPREYWWITGGYFYRYDPHAEVNQANRPLIDNNSADYVFIKKALRLEGPFYLMELCPGTLEDLLERDTRWIDLPVYRWMDAYRQSVTSLIRQTDDQRRQSSGRSREIDEEGKRLDDAVVVFCARYLNLSPLPLSGYDILNAFYTKIDDVGDETVTRLSHDPNHIRNNAVLQLFKQIVAVVAKLHRGTNMAPPLAHRDLKPGNLFLQHPRGNLGHVSFRLADLGAVITIADIHGNQSLRGARRGADYQAPGSQFYRAPEQADLPIEVRVDVMEDPRRIRVKGTKLGNIEPNDTIIINDLRGEEARNEALPPPLPIFKIRQVSTVKDNRDAYELELDEPVPISRPQDSRDAPADQKAETTNLHAQITKTPGFHTDGYSLGAILYDLASGGKNPEDFYTYCLKVFTRQFRRSATDEEFDTAQNVTDVLAPEPQQGSERLTFRDRRMVVWKACRAPNADALLEQIVESFYQKLSEADRKRKVRDLRFRRFHVVHDLLRDKRGVPIPREIIRLILRCMLRDLNGTFYQIDAREGYTTERHILAAEKIGEEVDRLLELPEFSLPRDNFPSALREDTLFKLRSLIPLVMGTQADGSAATAPVEQAETARADDQLVVGE